ncbi:MAG: 5'-nucleotidase domain-containing protein [Ignavibacteria bacterium]|nr:MAG: 5'-nucleotidase domain-containing protein [Ignavibacteria bacterium]KAF0160477.1 MAG: 5'-nucleotidase domain-containing protein [Ignavibacteria bacterium]
MKQGIEIEYDVRADSADYYTQDPYWSKVYGSLYSIYNDPLAQNILTESEVPSDYSISNYPNPFNPTTTISYQLPKDGMVTIKIYDVLGKEVATLVDEFKPAGTYNSRFSIPRLAGRESKRVNSQLSSGVYIATIQANNFSKSIKLLLTK